MKSTKRTTPSLAIQLNNNAIDEISNGNLTKASEMFSLACKQLASQNHHVHPERFYSKYRYVWVDCFRDLSRKLDGIVGFNESSMTHLCLKFLKIDPLDPRTAGESKKKRCTCCISWVLWYNLATVSALLAISIENLSSLLLRRSLTLLKKVQKAVFSENMKNYSKHLLTLHMAILNNEACALRDLAMPCESLSRLIDMGLILTSVPVGSISPRDHEMFLWTVKTFADDNYAAAA